MSDKNAGVGLSILVIDLSLPYGLRPPASSANSSICQSVDMLNISGPSDDGKGN
jgi:hypothetical protein